MAKENVSVFDAKDRLAKRQVVWRRLEDRFTALNVRMISDRVRERGYGQGNRNEGNIEKKQNNIKEIVLKLREELRVDILRIIREEVRDSLRTIVREEIKKEFRTLSQGGHLLNIRELIRETVDEDIRDRVLGSQEEMFF